MKFYIFFIFLIASTSSQAQETKVYEWPADWLGTWEGTMEIRTVGKTDIQRYPMKLQIAATDTAGRWQWTLTYGEGEKADVRPYVLIAQDSTHSHFIVDERNSILLDQYLIGNHFVSRFSVNSSLLIMDIRNEGDHLVSHITHGSTKDLRISGEELEEIDEVAAYPIRGMQRAILHKR